MACFYRVAIQDVQDRFLTFRVSEICRHENAFLEPCPSLALGFLWDALGYDGENDATPLGELVAGQEFFGGNYEQTVAAADQVVSCVGLTDYRVVVVKADGKWTHMTPGGDAAEATFNVAVTDRRWLEHVATFREDGNGEWESAIRSVLAAPAFAPAWRTPAVLALAQRIADTQEFDSLPALADALQAAGCDSAAVLDHFRGPGPHATGCWAVDLVLGGRWASDNPEAMLRELPSRASERKLRLFACACCRRVEDWAELACEGRGDHFRNALAVAERFADGAATAEELAAAHERTFNTARDRMCYCDPFETATDPEGRRVVEAAEQIRAAFLEIEPLTAGVSLDAPAVVKASRERVAQAAVLRDLFDNLFRPVAFSPEWRTDTVVTLARQMYESRDFSAMPILADALQDAGCDSDDILNHCRNPGGGSGEPAGGSSAQTTHVRGCWVVDLVLGKS